MPYQDKCKFCNKNFTETDETCDVYVKPNDDVNLYIKVHKQCCDNVKAGKISLSEIDFSDVPKIGDTSCQQ